jgi:hypothetical protein
MAMDKVLPGSSRAAFDFIGQHWQGLVRVSVIPMALIFIVSWIQLQNMSGVFEFMAMQAKLGNKMDSAAMAPFFAKMSKVYALGLIPIFSFIWIFVRIVRFWKTGEGEVFGFTKGEFGATFLTIVYGLGMILLTGLVYIGALLAFALVGGVGAAIFGGTSLAVAGSFVLIVVGIVCLLGIFVFMYRFIVGLPGIALGEVPGFFSDIWPLAKGESFGLPLRLLLWTLVAAIPITIIAFMFQFPLMTEIQDQLMTQEKPEMTPALISQLMRTMIPMQIVNMILQLPLIWFSSILLTEAHFRFRKKRSV